MWFYSFVGAMLLYRLMNGNFPKRRPEWGSVMVIFAFVFVLTLVYSGLFFAIFGRNINGFFCIFISLLTAVWLPIALNRRQNKKQ